MLDTLIAIIKLGHYDTGIPVTIQKQRSGNDETNAKYRIGPNQLDSGWMKHMALRDYFLPVFLQCSSTWIQEGLSQAATIIERKASLRLSSKIKISAFLRALARDGLIFLWLYEWFFFLMSKMNQWGSLTNLINERLIDGLINRWTSFNLFSSQNTSSIHSE